MGVSLGFGSSGAGLSIFANANKGTGNEKGNGTTWTETTLDAGRQVSLISGRDTVLKGAQVSADQIKAAVGRDLRLQSLQDTDDYKSKQTDVSGGASFTFGTMTGSGSLSISKSKIDSNYKSVQEQTGLFGGKGGYQIDVGNHTQLDGSVIASTATPDKNRLSTGTLGWSVLKNKADYTSQLQSVSVSSGASSANAFVSNMPSGSLVAFKHGDSDSGTTSSAISNGTLDIRDPAKQQQDVATLSHDVEHANGSISPIFDKEKEQKRLRQVQLIADIGTQASDIVRTQGAINAANAQKDPEAIAAARDKLIREGNTRPTDEQIAAQVTRTVMQPYGTGGDYQRAAQAVTAALQGLAGGDIGSALAGASAPYLANLIKQSTQGNDTARIMAHVVLGAVVAQAQGNSAGAGAAGAGTGELIAARLYPDIKTENLSEEQRQTISALSTLASGLAGGLAGGDLSGAFAGAKAGNNAVENNSLGDIASALAEGKTLEQKAEERIKAENERYKEQNCAGLSAQACSAQMYDERRENLAYTVAGGAVVAGTVAGAMLLGPALLNVCGMSPVVCTELTLTAAELPFGAATAGGTALGVGGFGSLAAKEVAATADAAAAARNVETAKGGALGAKATGEVVPPVPVVTSGTTRTGVVRTNAADWRALRDNWDDLGYGQILSTENRAAIAKGKTPKVDDAWVKVFPEDAGLKGERIPMHHVQGSPLTVPLPDTRHLDAHMPGGFRYNPGGPGSALPAYPPKKGAE
ncbi:hypothetical protein ALQ17_200071 [Pseudomonas fluorescens]|nr:hypothetical protein ALQ17_200071 [Pseudomonas fluorescens]